MTPARVLLFRMAATCFVLSVGTTCASAQDPAVVNAGTIRVKFENDRVRVLEATLPPGVREEVHHHPANVIYTIVGGKLRNYAQDGKVTEITLNTGDVVYREPLTHSAENIGDTTIRLELVELKEADAAKPASRQ